MLIYPEINILFLAQPNSKVQINILCLSQPNGKVQINILFLSQPNGKVQHMGVAFLHNTSTPYKQTFNSSGILEFLVIFPFQYSVIISIFMNSRERAGWGRI